MFTVSISKGISRGVVMNLYIEGAGRVITTLVITFKPSKTIQFH